MADFSLDNHLFCCVLLSRLIHPTSVGFEYAARIECTANGARRIIPYRDVRFSTMAFVNDPHSDWLMPDDVQGLKTLLTAFKPTGMPQRFYSALFLHEAAARNFFFNQRWTLVATGLEALVHIRGEKQSSGKRVGSTKAFVDRLLAIGAMDASLAVPEADLLVMYDERSSLAHGQGFGTPDSARKTLYSRMETLLASILKKVILDPGFAAIFASDASIQTTLVLRP